MHGAGNDFILIDNRNGFFTGREKEVFQRLCQRHLAIGADGLMLIDFENPQEFNLKYYNSDGNPAEMCGNGARCAVYFVYQIFPSLKEFTFTVFGNRYNGKVEKKEWVKIFWTNTPKVNDESFFIEKELSDISKILIIDSGVPHLILAFKKDPDEIDVSYWGKYYRNHPLFVPNGINVNFIKIDKNSIKIRTFERGVESETLACGTGALASAISADYWNLVEFPVKIFARGGILQVGRVEESKTFWLAGPVKVVFQGSFDLNSI
jgi:diaminopimelate epimerase